MYFKSIFSVVLTLILSNSYAQQNEPDTMNSTSMKQWYMGELDLDLDSASIKQYKANHRFFLKRKNPLKQVTTILDSSILFSPTGKITVVNFWEMGCPASMFEIPVINKLYDSYQSDTNIQFVTISPDSKNNLLFFTNPDSTNREIGAYRKFFDEEVIRFPIVSDPMNIILHEFRTLYAGYPQTFIFNKNGKLAVYQQGYRIAYNGEELYYLFLKDRIDKLLKL